MISLTSTEERRTYLADAVATFARFHDRNLITRLPNLLDLTSESTSGWHDSDRDEREALRALEPEAALLYLALVAKRLGEPAALKLANDLHKIACPDGVTIVLDTSDDDPLKITAHIQDELADEWADYHGSLDGGTWRCADGPDFVYDILYWRPGLFDELEKDGFDFDYSQYSEPDEHDIEVSRHASECDACQYDWHKASDHLGAIEAEPLFHQDAVKAQS